MGRSAYCEAAERLASSSSRDRCQMDKAPPQNLHPPGDRAHSVRGCDQRARSAGCTGAGDGVQVLQFRLYTRGHRRRGEVSTSRRVLRSSLRLAIPSIRVSLHSFLCERSALPADTRMSWGYRRSRRIAPGVRLNLGKRGIGMSVGPRHAKISATTSGRRSLYFSLLGFFFRKRL
jgi:hypothetical protein